MYLSTYTLMYDKKTSINKGEKGSPLTFTKPSPLKQFQRKGLFDHVGERIRGRGTELIAWDRVSVTQFQGYAHEILPRRASYFA